MNKYQKHQLGPQKAPLLSSLCFLRPVMQIIMQLKN